MDSQDITEQAVPELIANLTLQLGSFSMQTGEFAIPMQGVTVIFGRSGSGKSTLLRAISGLEPSVEGQIYWNNQCWLNNSQCLARQKRDIGFVFQDAALFPHLNVRKNLKYAVDRLPSGSEPARFDEIVERLGLFDMLDRSVSHLSGGEKQRVAIARALLTQPKLLCMDEPVSALDWKAKSEILNLIKDVVDSYRIPLIYITHSPAEVERLADHVVFMSQGKVDRVQTLQSALSDANSPLFADEGAVSVLEGVPASLNDGLRQIKMGTDSMWLFDSSAFDKAVVRVRVLARNVSLALSDPDQLSIMNHLPATVMELMPDANSRMLVRLKLDDGQNLFAEITRHSAKRLSLKTGTRLFALIKSVALTD